MPAAKPASRTTNRRGTTQGGVETERVARGGRGPERSRATEHTPTLTNAVERRAVRFPYDTPLVRILGRPLRRDVIGREEPLSAASLVEDVDGGVIRAAEGQEHDPRARHASGPAEDGLARH